MMSSASSCFVAQMGGEFTPEDFIHVLKLLRDHVARLVEVMESAVCADEEDTRNDGGADDVLEAPGRLAMARHDIRGHLVTTSTQLFALADAMLCAIAEAAADDLPAAQ